MMRAPSRLVTLSVSVAFILPYRVLAQAPSTIELVASTGREAVRSAAFSPDGKLLVIGYKEGVARLWDVASQRQIRKFPVRDSSVGLVEFAPDQSAIVTVTENVARLWSFVTGQQKQEFTLKCSIVDVSFRSADDLVALDVCGVSDPFRGAAARSWRLQLWDVSKKKEIISLNRDAIPGPASLSPDRTHALVVDIDPSRPASGNRDYAALLDLNSGTELFRFKHSQPIDAVAFSSDGKLALTGSQDKTACVWNISSGQSVKCFSENQRIRSVAFSGRNNVLIATNNAVNLWSIESGEKLQNADIGGSLVSTSSDGRQVFLGNGRKPGVLLDAQNMHDTHEISGNSASTESMTLSPDGRFLLTQNSDQYDICCTSATLWDLKAGTEANRLTADVSGTKLFDSDSTLSKGAGFVDSDPIVLASTLDGSAQLIDVATQQSIKLPQGVARCDLQANRIQFSSDGSKALVEPACSDAEIWDLKKNVVTHRIKATRHPSLTLSPRGDLVIVPLNSGDDWGLKELSSGKLRRLGDYDSKPEVAVFSDDQRLLLTAKYDTAQLWDVAKGSSIVSVQTESDNIKSLAISHDGLHLLTGGDEGITRLWDVRSGQMIGSYDCGPSEVPSVAFSFDSSSVAFTACSDGTVKMWEAKAQGTLLCSLVSFVDGGWAVIAPDGRFDTNRFEVGPTLSWVFAEEPLRPLPIEVFLKDYYTPGLLRDIVEHRPSKKVSLAQLNRSLPHVRIVGVAPEGDAPDRVTVRVAVASSKSSSPAGLNKTAIESGVYDLRLFRDGHLVSQTTSKSIPQLSGGSATNDLEKWRAQNEIIDSGETIVAIPHVQLPQRGRIGSTIFTAYAFNADRVKSETSPPFPYTIPDRAKPRSPRIYVVTMGVNYSQPGWDLSFAVSSAAKIAELWKRRVPTSETVPIMLTSDEDEKGVLKPGATATKAALAAVFDILAGRGATVPGELRKAIDPRNRLEPATPDDDVILYVASHGFVDAQNHQFYLVPFETTTIPGVDESLLTGCEFQSGRSERCDKARKFLDLAISGDDLNHWWYGIDANNMVLILDSCYSAAVIGAARPAPLGDPTFGQLSFDKGIQILAATQSDAKAQGLVAGEDGHTLLVDALDKVWAWETPPHQEDVPRLSREAPPVVIEYSGIPMSIRDWFRGAVRQLPQVYRKLRPDLKGDDLQVPEFIDFSPLATKPE